uniref:Guanine nucleotide exchange C9orf72-like n=1 Tax=Crassostrea virginica TaxID=6565 RepID=A0A8B8CCN4_CRAVI|nr:guanine nucleotide exchange C9orf72-like [Crassostrea virginica]XP_022313527.1 guanine nucleotide exchange C9orf72-like [Crassostrea virginica]XP_022313528.1 guanine nucleotide exchange C9orf72-like [Crassostrea virginica]
MSSSKNIKQLIRNMSAGVIQIGSQEKVETVDSFIEEATPLSPSSKFSESNINIPGHNLIKYMMLSHWDNILGPRVVHFWNMGTSEFDTSFLSRISSQSLSGEICREVTSFIDHKLYEISDADVFVTAFIFTAMGISGPCVHALSIVIQKSDMTFFLNIQHLFLKCFERIIRKFKVNLSQVSVDFTFETTYIEFGELCHQCIENIGYLKKSMFPQKILLSSTYLCPAHHLDRDFLSCCISSHLSTFGRSFVIGDKVDSVNMMVKTLSLFNSPKERCCSRLAQQNGPHPYHHDMWLQGQVQTSDHLDLPVAEILYSQYPTTIIDLSQKMVRESPAYTEHVIHSQDQWYNELIGLQYEVTEPSIPQGELFFLHDKSDTLVSGLLDELDKLPSDCGVREAYIQQFNRSIQYKALCIIKYVECETNSGTIPFKGDLKKLQKDVCILSEGDFRIYLSAAEKLKPGLMGFIYSSKFSREHSNSGLSTNKPYVR